MKYLLLLFFIISFNLEAEEKWPKTLDGAVINILSLMDDESKNKVRQMAKNDLIKFHHSWGRGIRNSFGLWKGNKELIVSSCGQYCHPDEASMKIIEAVWIKLNEKPQ